MSSPRRNLYLKIAGILAVFALAFYLNTLVVSSKGVQQLVSNLGYLGVFFFASLSGFNVVIPIPAIAFLPALTSAGLDTFWVIILVSLGMTLGDSLGFLLGKAGRGLNITISRKIGRFLSFLENGDRLLLFAGLLVYASFVPLPNELIIIPLALAGYSYRQIIIPVLIGNFVFNSLSAFGVFGTFALLEAFL